MDGGVGWYYFSPLLALFSFGICHLFPVGLLAPLPVCLAAREQLTLNSDPPRLFALRRHPLQLNLHNGQEARLGQLRRGY